MKGGLHRKMLTALLFYFEDRKMGLYEKMGAGLEMGRKKMLFIYNPKAGKERIRSNLLDLIDIFTKAGYEVTAYPTQGTGDAANVVMERDEKYQMITCSGGDGTLDEVVNGMMRSNQHIPIGYVPAGSTNDFAMSLGIPASMKAAAEVVTEGRDYSCDVGTLNGESFVYIAAFGVFTDVSYQTRQDLKNVLGHMAYVMEGMKKLSEIRSYHMKVVYDNTVIEDDFIFGMVTNSISVGGFKRITGKYVELDDGVFEVTLIKLPHNMIELSNIMAALVDRDINTNYMYCYKTARLTIDSGEAIAWTRDGEYGGYHRHVEIINENKGLVIRVPKV